VDNLRTRWKLVLLVTVVALVGIQLCFWEYNKLQTAADADAFRRTLGDDTARAIGAALCDMVFAVGYGLLGLIALRAVNAKGVIAVVGGVLVLASSLFDECENVFLIRNIASHTSIGNSDIDGMQVFGTLKWVGEPVFAILLILLAVRAVRRRRA
jgi:hypothetical protein